MKNTYLFSLLTCSLLLTQVSCETPEEQPVSESPAEKEKRLAIDELKLMNINYEQFDQKLIDESAKGSVKRMELLLKAGADVHAVDAKGNTPLLLASNRKKNNIRHLELLLAHGADIDVTNEKNESPLIAAIQRENIEAVQFLLGKGAVLNAADEQGKLAVKCIAKCKNVEIIKLFIQLSVEQGDDVLLRSLIDSGVSLASIDCNSLLHEAVLKDKLQIVQIMIDAGVNPCQIIEIEGQKRTLLSVASSDGMKKMLKDKGCIEVISLDDAVELLIRYEIINPYAASKVSERFNFAAEDFKESYIDDSYRKESEKFLYNYRLYKDGQKKISDYDYVLCMYNLWHKGNRSKHLPLECIMSFIVAGSSNEWVVSGKYDGEWHSLDFAALNGHSQIVQALLNKGAKGKNLLQKAVVSKDINTIKVLLNVPGIDVNEGEELRINRKNDIYTEGVSTPLGVAALKGYLDIVKLLLTVPGIDVNKGYARPLQCAAEEGHIEIVKALLDAPGIDVNEGSPSPLRCAVEEGYIEIVKALLDAPGIDLYFNENCFYHHVRSSLDMDVKSDIREAKALLEKARSQKSRSQKARSEKARVR